MLERFDAPGAAALRREAARAERQLARKASSGDAPSSVSVSDPTAPKPFDPSRLIARLGHYYPWLSDAVALRMPWKRLLMYAREMSIAIEEENQATQDAINSAKNGNGQRTGASRDGHAIDPEAADAEMARMLGYAQQYDGPTTAARLAD